MKAFFKDMYCTYFSSEIIFLDVKYKHWENDIL